MPGTGKVQWSPGEEDDPSTGYRSAFSHDNEEAAPGYYKVLLDDSGVTVELTATERTGMHRYTFPESKNAHILIDLYHRGRVEEANIRFVSDTVVTGLTMSNGWARKDRTYFYAVFSRPFKNFGIAVDDKLLPDAVEAEGKVVKAFAGFETQKGEQVLVKVGVSAVSVAGARKNLESDNPGWDFDDIRRKATNKWNEFLSKIEVEGGTQRDRCIFYTAMYHTALAPNIFMDVDGRYRGVDHKVHRAEGFTNYTIYSL